MKILHIIPELNKGGAERLLIDICHELKKEHQVDIVLFRPGNAFTEETLGLNIHVIPSKIKPSIFHKWIIDTDGLSKFITDLAPDIIHSHLFESEFILSKTSTGKAIRFTHFHDNMCQFERFTWRTILNKTLLTNYLEKRWVLESHHPFDHHYIGISDHTINYIHKSLINANHIWKLENAIPLYRFPKKALGKFNMKIVTVGSLTENKAQLFSIQILADLHQAGYPFSLDIIGEGPLRSKLEKQVISLGLETYVNFVGHVTNPSKHYQEAFVSLHTAFSEAFGLVILESMASGTPVISTDGGGNRLLINHQQNGYIFSERDCSLFSNTIINLWNNSELYLQLQKAAIETSLNYDIFTYCSRLVKIYEKALKESEFQS